MVRRGGRVLWAEMLRPLLHLVSAARQITGGFSCQQASGGYSGWLSRSFGNLAYFAPLS